MAEDLIVALENCQPAIEYEFVVVDMNGKVARVRGVVVDPDDQGPWDVPMVHLMTPPEGPPRHIMRSEIRKIRVVCPECDGTLWDRGFTTAEENPQRLGAPYIRCADCFWAPSRLDDEVLRFMPKES